MRLTWFAYIRWGLLLLFASFASVLVPNIFTQQGEASTMKSVRSVAQSATNPASTRGRYNGLLIFGSDRQNDGGDKIWSMNADGSNPTQLTFESDRGPTLPSYAHIYEGAGRWSPDGAKIAFRSNRNADPANPQLEAYTLYIMNYP